MLLSASFTIADFLSKSYGEGRNIFSTITYNSQVPVQSTYSVRRLHSIAADTYPIQYMDYAGTEQSLNSPEIPLEIENYGCFWSAF